LRNKTNSGFYDFYIPTLGQKSKEKYTGSLKVADMSIIFSQQILRSSKAPELLRIWDNASTLSRFNDEKNWVEFELTRRFSTAAVQNSNLILPVIRGIHSEWAYKQLETNADAIIDFRLDETGDQTRNIVRISNFRNVDFNSQWHQVEIKSNGEAILSA
jgi:KaiC/GvpD/RAD55 family RecA-like ATPase